MPFSFFQILNFVIVLVVLVLLVRYLWGMFFDTGYQPEEWQHRKKQGMIRPVLQKLERQFPDKVRFFNWWFQVERLNRAGVPGAFAELGVYKGESARVLHAMDPERVFYLFDTFEGFSGKDLESETGEAATYTTRNFADTSMDKVRHYVSGNDNIKFCPGYFPGSAIKYFSEASIGNEGPPAFALVNIDVDLYNPTKAGLEYFYPLLSPAGVIIVHDYTNKWEGVKKAVDEFCRTIPEWPVEVPDVDGTVMIIKG